MSRRALTELTFAELRAESTIGKSLEALIYICENFPERERRF